MKNFDIETYLAERTALRDGDMLLEEHKGGCVLYERRRRVEALLTGG